MPWNEPGGDDKDPWSSNNKTSKKNSSKSSSSNASNVTEIFNDLSGGNGNKILMLLPLVLIAIWFFLGWYTVDTGERGVVLRFGAFKEITTSGLHWRPVLIDSVEIVNVAKTRTADDRTTMLTKDENIVDLAVEAQYQVSDPKAYLFNVFLPDYEPNQPVGTLYQAMRSAIKEVVGRSDMDYVIKEGSAQVAIDTQDLLQKILDSYGTGIKIKKVNLTYAEAPKQVKDAFDDANRAREDMARSKNRAQTYANKVLPEARGNAARLQQESIAYKDRVVARAEGDASRFSQLTFEYQKAPDVTRERLYLDTMEQVLSGSKKIMMDTNAGNNVFYLPLNTQEGGNESQQGNIPVPPVPEKLLNQLQQQRSQAINGASHQQSRRPGSTSLREGR